MRSLLIGINYSPEVTGIGPFTTELAEHLVSGGSTGLGLDQLPVLPALEDRSELQTHPAVSDRDDQRPWVDAGRLSVRAALGAPDGETLALHTGNMGAKQGLETVLEAAAQLAGENIVLTLVGDGQPRLGLEAQATRVGLGNLRFLPLQADLPATLAAADLLVLAQRGQVIDSAALSKLLSYMASGKPIVAAVNEFSEAGQLISPSGVRSCGPAGATLGTRGCIAGPSSSSGKTRQAWRGRSQIRK